MAKLDGWPAGVNNIAPDVALPTDDRGNVIALRDAVNVDVLDDGKLRLRPGIERILSEPNAHSVFSNGDLLVWATANTLRVSDVNYNIVTVLTDSRLATPISCVDVNGDIYFSNEYINGIIRADRTYEPWGLEVPTQAPTLTAITTGPNLFSVTCTFITDDGQESGAPIGRAVYCADNPAFTLSNIPQPTDLRIVAVRIYMTNIDGIEYQQVIELPKGITAYVINGFFAYGNVLTTQFMLPPPKGQLLEFSDGIVYIASGKNVFHTEPLNFGLYNPTKNYFMYSERVTLLKSHEGGMYIASDELHFLKNIGSDGVVQSDIMPYRAVEAAVCEVPDSRDFMFMSDRGFVKAGPGGQVANLTEKNIAVDTYSRGAMGYTSVGGHRAVIAVFKNPIASKSVSEDYTDDIKSRKQAESNF